MNNNQWLKNLITVNTTITKIGYINKCFQDSGKIKTAFYCKGSKKDRLCIYWERVSNNLKEGDEVILTGRIKPEVDIFMINSMIILNNKKEVANGN